MLNRCSIILISFLLVAGCNPGPEDKPSIDDLVGIYKLVEAPSLCGFNINSNENSKITLKKDLSVSIEGIPDCINHLHGETKGELLNGVGTWEIVIPEVVSSYGLMFDISSNNSMKAGLYNTLVIVGKEKPFKLLYIIGDPDSMYRLTYEKLN